VGYQTSFLWLVASAHSTLVAQVAANLNRGATGEIVAAIGKALVERGFDTEVIHPPSSVRGQTMRSGPTAEPFSLAVDSSRRGSGSGSTSDCRKAKTPRSQQKREIVMFVSASSSGSSSGCSSRKPRLRQRAEVKHRRAVPRAAA
jgi:hypothetical protein